MITDVPTVQNLSGWLDSVTVYNIIHRIYHYPTDCTIHWVVIYPLDRVIHRLNNLGQVYGSRGMTLWYFVSSNQLLDVSESQSSLPSPRGGLMLRLGRSLLKNPLRKGRGGGEGRKGGCPDSNLARSSHRFHVSGTTTRKWECWFLNKRLWWATLLALLQLSLIQSVPSDYY